MSFKGQGQFNLSEGLVQTIVLCKYEDNPFINYQDTINYISENLIILHSRLRCYMSQSQFEFEIHEGNILFSI
jgi:hypothetical protein